VSDRARILLVDDRPENLLALEAILEPLGQELVRAESGEEALRQLLHGDFALILLDVQMPGLDGFETASLVKQRVRTRHVPIIFLTAISKEAEHVFRGYGVGAVDYLMKPLDAQVLQAKVTVFIDLWRAKEEARRSVELLGEQELATERRESEERYRSLAEALPQIIWTSDANGRTTYVNERWYEVTGLDRDGTAELAAVIHPEDRRATSARWRESLSSGAVFELEYRVRHVDGTYRWQLARALPIFDGSGTRTGWVGTATDIEDRKRMEERQSFLAEAGWVLGSSLDYEQTLSDVARLAVPRVADWCTVDIFVGDKLERLAIEHVDSLKLALASELEEQMLAAAQAAGAAAIRSQEPVLVREIDDAALASFGFDERQLEIARALAPRSYVTVPLIARGEVFGAISLVTAESARTYEEEDVALAQELARHAAAAIDNARLYEESERRGRAARVLAAVGDGVVMVDLEGAIRLWNPAAAAITGLRETEVLGQRMADVVPGWTEPGARIPVGDPGAHVRAETVPIEVDGRELWISASGVRLDEGTVYAFRDLTEERALEQLKSEFVATVSHELRTPLAAIYGSAQTIRRDDLDLGEETRHELLGVIATEADRLASIVNDLLVASHLDSGWLAVQIERCNPFELARAVVESAKTHLPGRVELKLKTAKELPHVAADAGQLQQVLTNLVDNAIKYSPEGGVVRLELQNGDAGVRFSVIDNGLGIPGSEHRRIFEKFYRLDPDMTRGVGGTGLGLYICRELVRRMHGEIWVESRLGKGSTFVVELPAANARQAKPSPRRSASVE